LTRWAVVMRGSSGVGVFSPDAKLSAREALAALDEAAPGVPLAAFGQTPFWDEPMKAILAAETERPMLVGVHGLDFISRLRGLLPGPEWQIVSRNDGSLRDAWIAAGELSALFGAEVCPTRQTLAEAGVRISNDRAGGAALDEATSCWGWRAVVQNSERPYVVCDAPVAEVAPALRELLRWGFGATAEMLSQADARRGVRGMLRSFLRRLDGFPAENPEGGLCAFYKRLFQDMYCRLLGSVPENVRITSTPEVFRFNVATARRGRFRFVRHFLCGRMAEVARAAYDAAVGGSSINPLSSFGEFATPFDVYVPGRGRGTLHIEDKRVRVDLRTPVTLSLRKPLRSVTELARVLECGFGGEVSLVGKAVALPVMFGGEFVLVLNETGSAYLPMTQEMVRAMTAAGARLKPYPILRIRMRTWDMLRGCGVEFRLPRHLAESFEREVISADEFARRWRRVVHDARRLLERLKREPGMASLVEYLGHREHERWFRRLERCARAHATLLEVQRGVDALRHRAMKLRMAEDALLEEMKTLEEERGKLNRTRLRPLKRKLGKPAGCLSAGERERISKAYEEAEREGRALLDALESKREERRRVVEERKAVGRKIRATEHSAKAQAARESLRVVNRMGQKARLALARRAILTAEGLCRGNARPSAWWMSAVDPSGGWFERIRRSARYRLESLQGGES